MFIKFTNIHELRKKREIEKKEEHKKTNKKGKKVKKKETKKTGSKIESPAMNLSEKPTESHSERYCLAHC